MSEISELNDFSEVESLRDDWNKILQQCRDKDVFSTWEWLSCWWKHFGRERKLKVLTVKDGDRIIGIAPLMLSEYSFLHLGKFRKIEFIGTPHSDYNNLLLLSEESRCVKLFFNHLMELADWDLLELKDVREETACANAFREIRKDKGQELRVFEETLCPYIRLPSSREEFFDHLSSNMRRNLRRRMRKLQKSYKFEVRTQDDFNSVGQAMKTFFDLHQRRWTSKGKPGAFASKVFRNFHLNLAEVFQEKGWLALYFLVADDEPVAALYTFEYNNKKYGYLSGFEPEFARYGVGNLLKLHVIEDCLKKGIKEYDLTRGFELYKADWATGVRRNLGIRMAYKGLFARLYDRAMQSGLSLFLIRRFGASLDLEHIGVRQVYA
jgi:CelD/BcsL family acetyltransferase involved in cellulose biosynthesis